MKKRLGVMLVMLVVLSIMIFSNALLQYPLGSAAFAQSTEEVIPSIRITYPTYCNDLLIDGNLTVQGTAYDEESGIEKVEVYVHALPIDDEFSFEMAEPVSGGNWSQWSYDTHIPDDDKTYRILVQATDGVGNVNTDETFVNSERMREIQKVREISDNGGNSQVSDRIALVTPTFTSAAYNYDSFYFFYYRYASVAEGTAITDDLNLMTGQIPTESEDAAIIESFADRIKAFAPESIVSVIRDENVHHGLIFAEDGRNAYDALVMFHNEYVTQEEYDNLRKFVNNGGNIVFINSNIFYAEVTLDETSCMVTLVKGHNWEFDGKAVRKGVWERYAEENKEWMGSNFINRDISNPVRFDNNPFGYTHFEENELLNDNAKVLIDYEAKFKLESANNPLIIGGLLKPDEYSDLGMRVATYELQSGTGKVIMLGIYGQNLVNNTAFTTFFDKIVLPRAFGVNNELNIDGEAFELYSKLQDGRLSRIILDKESKSLILNLDIDKDAPIGEKLLTITLPKALIDANNKGAGLASFTVLVDGKVNDYSQSNDDIERAIAVSIPSNAKEVRIIGTQVVPEFGFTLLLFGLICALPFALRLYTINSRRRA